MPKNFTFLVDSELFLSFPNSVQMLTEQTYADLRKTELSPSSFFLPGINVLGSR